MANYKQPQKLKYLLDGDDKPVKIKLDGFDGTVVSLNFSHKNQDFTLIAGDTKTIGTSGTLKSKDIRMSGAANNVDGDVKLRVTIWKEEEQELVYNFPEDYTGSPSFKNEKILNYSFFVNFV